MIYATKLKEIQILAKRMNVGLGKLSEAGESVEILRKDLEIKEKDIAIANKEAEAVGYLLMLNWIYTFIINNNTSDF